MEELIEFILKNSDNLLIISTDLSHFYSQSEANQKDNSCLNALINLDIYAFNDCEACGMRGLESLISIASKYNWKSKLLDYRTSLNVNNDESSVVGYMSGVIF